MLQNSLFGRVSHIVKQSGVLHLTFELSHLRKLPKCCGPRFATILLRPDCEGHKPKRKDNDHKKTTVVLHNSINSINYSLMGLSCQSWSTNSWCISAWGLVGLSPRPHVDWQVRGKNNTNPKSGYQLSKQEIFVRSINDDNDIKGSMTHLQNIMVGGRGGGGVGSLEKK